MIKNMIIMEKVKFIDLNNNHYNLYHKNKNQKKIFKEEITIEKIFMKIKKICS